MDALEYFKIKKRMTNKCEMDCVDCPLYYANSNKQLGCKRFEMLYPKEAIKIVEDWEKEHPFVTNADKYKEIIRKTFGDNFEIEICGNKPYENIPDCRCCMMNCDECIEFWNSEYIEKEEE